MIDLKQRMTEGASLVGTMVNLVDHHEVARVLKACGFDFFMIDCEHGYFDPSAAGRIIALARESGIPPFVRIPEVRRDVVLMYMEMGAAGLMLPQTETAEQARALVSYAKYAPQGNRGISMLRPHARFEKVDALEHMRRTNAETILMVQIESPEAVAAIDQIMAVQGIDVAFIGPNDLTQSMGIAGETNRPEFLQAVEQVIASSRRHGKHSGIHFMSAGDLEPWMRKGMSFNLWANELTLMMNAAREGLARLRNAGSPGGAPCRTGC